jgi:hypothetical protein
MKPKPMLLPTLLQKILLAPLCLLPVFANADVTTGLVARYAFDGDAEDSSGYTNNGILHNVSFGPDRHGVADGAVYFQGRIDSYINIPVSPVLDFPSNITVCGWCSFEGGSDTPGPRLVSLVCKDDSGAYCFAVDIPNGRFTTIARSGGVAGYEQVQSACCIPWSTWFHFAAVITRTELRLYINGVLSATNSGFNIPLNEQTSAVNIGRMAKYGWDAWKGYADDIRIYNRALSAAEVEDVYGAGFDTEPPKIVSPGDIHVPCDIAEFVPVTFNVTAVDNSDPAPTIVCIPPSGSDFPVGVTPVTCVATDASGNSDMCTFNVIREPLGFAGFLAPLGGADAEGGSFDRPLKVAKVGSTIPVKFVAWCGDEALKTGVHTLQAVLFRDPQTAIAAVDAVASDAVTTESQFRYSDGRWQFNLDTRASGMTTGKWKVILTLSDGSVHYVWLQLR